MVEKKRKFRVYYQGWSGQTNIKADNVSAARRIFKKRHTFSVIDSIEKVSRLPDWAYSWGRGGLMGAYLGAERVVDYSVHFHGRKGSMVVLSTTKLEALRKVGGMSKLKGVMAYKAEGV